MFFFILYGKKQVTKTIGSGSFHCPQCDGEQPYWQKSLQEKGHLYYLSILSLGEKIEFVECRACEAVFQPEVLSYKPGDPMDALRSDFDTILRRLMVLMMMADGAVDEAEIEMMILIFHDVAGQILTPEDVRADISLAESAGHSVADFTDALAHVLTDEAKALVVKAVMMIAASDDSLDDIELEMVSEIANRIEITEDAFNAVLASFEDDP